MGEVTVTRGGSLQPPPSCHFQLLSGQMPLKEHVGNMAGCPPTSGPDACVVLTPSLGPRSGATPFSHVHRPVARNDEC